MSNNVIEFRWLQKEDPDGNKIGAPVLQTRHKFLADGDGHFVTYWDWQEWEDVPLVVETDWAEPR